MEVLLWLLPAVVVTLLAMAWVGWVGRRERRAERRVDPEVAAARMGEALGRAPRRGRTVPSYAAPERPADRSTGVAVRRRAS